MISRVSRMSVKHVNNFNVATFMGIIYDACQTLHDDTRHRGTTLSSKPHLVAHILLL